MCVGGRCTSSFSCNFSRTVSSEKHEHVHDVIVDMMIIAIVFHPHPQMTRAFKQRVLLGQMSYRNWENLMLAHHLASLMAALKASTADVINNEFQREALQIKSDNGRMAVLLEELMNKVNQRLGLVSPSSPVSSVGVDVSDRSTTTPAEAHPSSGSLNEAGGAASSTAAEAAPPSSSWALDLPQQLSLEFGVWDWEQEQKIMDARRQWLAAAPGDGEFPQVPAERDSELGLLLEVLERHLPGWAERQLLVPTAEQGGADPQFSEEQDVEDEGASEVEDEDFSEDGEDDDASDVEDEEDLPLEDEDVESEEQDHGENDGSSEVDEEDEGDVVDEEAGVLVQGGAGGVGRARSGRGIEFTDDSLFRDLEGVRGFFEGGGDIHRGGTVLAPSADAGFFRAGNILTKIVVEREGFAGGVDIEGIKKINNHCCIHNHRLGG